jgi:hypothetical protein
VALADAGMASAQDIQNPGRVMGVYTAEFGDR